MQGLQDFLSLIHSYLGGHLWFVLFLLGIGIFFTIYLGFPQIKFFRHALQIVSGKYDKHDDDGDISHFQALTTALSGTVGTGNIGGVAFAVHLGGPKALFWMLVTAFFGMTTKFVEVTLSHKYREKAEDGTIAGGPMYYMKNKLNMKWLAITFAIGTVFSSFGTGSLPQINNMAQAMQASFNTKPLVVGIVASIILAFVIIGGIKRIANVTSTLVPFMSIIYFLGAISVILYNFENLGRELIILSSDLFEPSAIRGGFLGAAVAFTFQTGVGRGLFSNEAGQGSAAIAHASAKTKEPVSEGIVALLEPFIDTILICTLTGFALISSGVWSEKHETTLGWADTQFIQGKYDDNNAEDQKLLSNHVNTSEMLPYFNGEMIIENGNITSNLSIIHNKSLTENIVVYTENDDGTLVRYSGKINIENGHINLEDEHDNLVFKGKSLIHSAELTTKAFTRGFFGETGKYIVPIGLLLFAFSTAVSWSYYGDRAMNFLFGQQSVLYYRILYVIGFVLAAVVDTKIIWKLADIAIVCMTLPNLIGIFLLRKDMKETLKKYWKTISNTNKS